MGTTGGGDGGAVCVGEHAFDFEDGFSQVLV